MILLYCMGQSGPHVVRRDVALCLGREAPWRRGCGNASSHMTCYPPPGRNLRRCVRAAGRTYKRVPSRRKTVKPAPAHLITTTTTARLYTTPPPKALLLLPRNISISTSTSRSSSPLASLSSSHPFYFVLLRMTDRFPLFANVCRIHISKIICYKKTG